MKKINLFVYGSLREGFFNYDKYLAGKVVEKKDASLENMRLYHMPYKGYPAITPGNDKVLGEIILDIFKTILSYLNYNITTLFLY